MGVACCCHANHTCAAKMASEDCLCCLVSDYHKSSEDKQWFPHLSACLEYTLEHGVKVSHLVVEQPAIHSCCESILAPPTLKLGHETQYFRPHSNQSSSSKRSGSSSKQLQLVASDNQDLGNHLLYLCVHGLTDALQLILDKCTSLDLNAPLAQSGSNKKGLTPLSWAALNSNGPMCRQLVGKGAAVNARDSIGRTALHWAALGGWLVSVKALLKLGADPSIVDENDLSPLHYACVLGLQDIVTALLKETTPHVDLPHKSSGSTALMLACYKGHTSTAKLLLKSHANPLLANEQGLTPLHCSVWSGDLKCVKLLLGQLPKEAITARDVYGRTALHVAALKGDVSLCQLLVKKGATLSQVDTHGRSTLHWAVLSEQPSCVEYVLSQGAVSQTDSQGSTPLHYAAISPSSQLTELLIGKGADLDVCDAKARPPLLWASAFGQSANVKCLLVREEGELRALHAAASVGAVDLCQMLIDWDKQCIDVVTAEGHSALHLASKFGHSSCVQLLVSSGANLEALNQQKETSLHLACTNGHAQTVDRLLSNGASQRVALNDQWPVHMASSRGHKDVLDTLIRYDSGVLDQRTSVGQTPLHFAAQSGHLDCCRLLVDRGCDLGAHVNNTERHTALDLAMLEGHNGCADYLTSVDCPSGGGPYHRAALTIQAVWRYHRHKRRLALRRQWSAVAIQRAFRHWNRRRAASLLRQARHKYRENAARVIQQHWRVFIGQKRRYEASYTQLKARLRQETLATTLILSQLHLSAQSVSLPPPVPTQTHGPNARYLLMASSNPAPIFPSGSLLFPAKPRTPLNRTLPHQMKVSRRSPQTRPMRSPRVAVTSGDKLRLPPVNTRPLLQMSYEEEMSRGSLVSSQQRGSTVIDHINPSTSMEANQGETSRGSLIAANQGEMSRGSLTAANQDKTSRGFPIETVSPPLLASSVEKLPKLPTQISLVSMGSNEPDHPHIEQHTDKRQSIKLPSQAQTKLTRQSTFKTTPLASLVSQQPPIKAEKGLETLQLPEVTDHATESIIDIQRDKDDSHQLSELGVDDTLLNSIQRYDKLNQILSLLHQAREGGSKQQEEVKLSRLKDQIMGALDEAVRLRAETQALQDKRSKVLRSFMGDLVESVKRALCIQELRQAGYRKLRQAHNEYTSHTIAPGEYQKSMSEVTSSFQALSQEMIELAKVFREHSLVQAAEVLDNIQAREKEKLHLTAQWQVLNAESHGEDKKVADEYEDPEQTHKQKELRQKLASVEGDIAGLVQDLRFECEHILLPAMMTDT